jgi:hypothetical protein
MGPSAEPLLLPHAAVVLRYWPADLQSCMRTLQPCSGICRHVIWGAQCSATARLAATCSQYLLPSRSARNGRSSATFQ